MRRWALGLEARLLGTFVGLGFVAAWGAGAARRGFLVVDGQVPLSKGDGVCDHGFVTAGVDGVAGAATATVIGGVDMDRVEVSGAVAEAGLVLRGGGGDECAIVALEAEGVGVVGILLIEVSFIGSDEEFVV